MTLHSITFVTQGRYVLNRMCSTERHRHNMIDFQLINSNIAAAFLADAIRSEQLITPLANSQRMRNAFNSGAHPMITDLSANAGFDRFR